MQTIRIALIATFVASALSAQGKVFSRADTLRGSDGPHRAWWDVQFYDLHVTVNPADSSISGWNAITYKRVLRPGKVITGTMQIDLQVPMQIDSAIYDHDPNTAHSKPHHVRFRRDSNAYFVSVGEQGAGDAPRTLTIYFHGKPRPAVNPPWDGGFIWRRDSVGNRFIATANQGLGASVWWPNKDYGAEEPDSQRIAITVPDSLVNVSNGRLRSVRTNGDGTTTWEWFVSRPINNYGISVNAAKYAHFTDYYQGELGVLTMDYYPLAINEDTARVQMRQAIPTVACFERWFGPFPWYEDGFKLVETPHLGMEHQSAVAYGNHYKNGYRGRDLSQTGWGLKWDFIIVHEVAHEWWANNITAKDIADMWVHESFANYAEGIYTECTEGPAAGAEYIIGSRANIKNESPIVGVFGVHEEGSGDMYYKGGSMLHTIRQVVNDDRKWRETLRGANRTFWHQTITGQQLRDYFSTSTGVDLSRIFRQYLETTMIPTLEYKRAGGTLSYRWGNVIPGFDMPVDVAFGDPHGPWKRITPTAQWQTMPATGVPRVRRDFYVEVREVR